jgi:dihydrofolate synthase/folylpolyglutamate synthase
MRPNKPVICGDFQTPDSVKKYAKQISANLFCQNEDFAYSVKDNEWCWWNNSNKTRQSLPLPQLELQNAATVLAAVEHLTPYFRITDENICYALTHTQLPGRFQIINGSIKQILDVAHNPAATELLAKRLAQETCQHRIHTKRLSQETRHHRIHAVFAMLNDKDHLGTIKPLIPLIHDWYIASLDIPRGSKSKQLAEIVINGGARSVYTYDNVLSAYQAAMLAADPGDYVLIFGSFYLVVEVLKQL